MRWVVAMWRAWAIAAAVWVVIVCVGIIFEKVG
jgi:hypothetical protein